MQQREAIHSGATGGRNGKKILQQAVEAIVCQRTVNEIMLQIGLGLQGSQFSRDVLHHGNFSNKKASPAKERLLSLYKNAFITN